MNERLVFVILLGVISVLWLSLDIGGGKPEKRRF
ncbi:hypothetical protein GGR14_000076 [Butyricimonas faecihominis]|uniref:Uncharacterized protein n=1 Tax=Butyricimonas faecihominis TaxID=1472416 RepID=A0A7W6HTA1_9BACT|nr:hypothetical protein [Butyricimonas faecihominis]